MAFLICWHMEDKQKKMLSTEILKWPFACFFRAINDMVH